MRKEHTKKGDIMPSRKSNISFGLVNIPVILNPVVKNNDVSFNQLHKKCGDRISYLKYCPRCKIEVKESEIIKGYQYEKGTYLEFTKKELEDLKPESSDEIEIISFVPLKEIDPCYFEKSYKLNTEKKSKAYNLFVSALKKTNLVGLCKTILFGKFYYAIVRFHETNIILTTLYFEEEINLSQNEFTEKIGTKELDLAIKLIENLKGHFEPQKYKDLYQEKVKEAIENKLNGKKVKKTKKSPKKEVTDLMKALEMSLKK